MAKSKVESTKNVEFAKGGNTPMIGHQAAGPQDAGDTAHDTSGDGGKFAAGGSTRMFGFSPSASAKAGITSAR